MPTIYSFALIDCVHKTVGTESLLNNIERMSNQKQRHKIGHAGYPNASIRFNGSPNKIRMENLRIIL